MALQVATFYKLHVNMTIKDSPPIEDQCRDDAQLGANAESRNHRWRQDPQWHFDKRAWGLEHQAGVITYPHHDAKGAGAFVIVLSGVKHWVVIGTKQLARKHPPELLVNMGDSQSSMLDFLADVDAETIHLNTGDIVAMPLGQYHMVYTLVVGFCRGACFYIFDTMHLTKVSGFVNTT
ncbi:hypothetical protein JVT61DRAFT_14416 [Boletus reticuloceps]|uniref:JmjC domain-containing protein n=1 Tax=Boletus reticuloceps TaxID=495285 RepID=A0A8I2YVH0_9AGAM|nr:hypothetical protein JVT61DRAFT_14416 [Boletus reticuloceps]